MDDFQTLVLKWLDEQMTHYQKAIAQRKAYYLKKKWAWSDNAVSDFNRRIKDLEAARSSILIELSSGKAHGQKLLNLANIVFNEAGVKKSAAKLAIAFAWLNRTRGDIREPKNKTEISHYVPLLQRWKKLTDGQRLTFLQNFASCLKAARQRLNDKEPAKNDPTRGATHWVSPAALEHFKKQNGRYARTVGTATNRAFPVWARRNSDPEVAKMKKSGALKENYAELTLPGIDQTDFLFYVGVAY